jgi:hypothetical protein
VYAERGAEAVAEMYLEHIFPAYGQSNTEQALSAFPPVDDELMDRNTGRLIGGAMGIGIGRVIGGDSLFSRRTGAARIAVADMAARLAAAGGLLIDARWDSAFLRSLGAGPVPRQRYLPLLGRPAERTALPTRPLPARRLPGASRSRMARRPGVSRSFVLPLSPLFYICSVLRWRLPLQPDIQALRASAGWLAMPHRSGSRQYATQQLYGA